MGFFSSIKRLWSSNKPAETQETPQAPAEEALAAPQPAETEDGASHEESSVSDAPQSPVVFLEKLPETAAAEQQQADLEMDQLAAGQSLEPDGQAPAPAAAAQPAPQPDAPKEPSGWRDTLLLTLREAEPRLSVWLSIALEDLGPDARTGDELWERVRFLLTALGAPENEADAFVADFAAWAARMEYEEVADFRSELQYRLALALDLEDEEDERNRIFLKLHQGLERTREQLGKGLSTLFASHGDLSADFWDELEELFIMADMGVEAATELCKRLKSRARAASATTPEELRPLLARRRSRPPSGTFWRRRWTWAARSWISRPGLLWCCSSASTA